MTDSALLTPPEVARLLNVPERTLSQWRYLRRGPTYIVCGRHVRYRRRDVEAYLDANRVPTGTPSRRRRGADGA